MLTKKSHQKNLEDSFLTDPHDERQTEEGKKHLETDEGAIPMPLEHQVPMDGANVPSFVEVTLRSASESVA